MIKMLAIIAPVVLVIALILFIQIYRALKHPHWLWMIISSIFLLVTVVLGIAWFILRMPTVLVVPHLITALATAVSFRIATGELLATLYPPGEIKEEIIEGFPLLGEDIQLLKIYTGFTNKLMSTMTPMVGLEGVKAILNKTIMEFPTLLDGCRIDDGTLNTEPIHDNLENINDDERTSTLFNAFSELNSSLFDRYTAVTSRMRMINVVIETTAGYIERYSGHLSKAGVPLGRYNDLLYRYGLFMGTPAGIAEKDKLRTFIHISLKEILEPLLSGRKVATINVIKNRIGELAKTNPILENIELNVGGKIGLDRFYDIISEQPLGEESLIRRAIKNTILELLNIAIPVIQRDVGLWNVKKVTENAINSLPKKFDFLLSFPELVRAMPESVLERERFSLLSKEELEQAVRERTAVLNRMHDELKKIDRLKSEFIDAASHELRTPLTPVNVYLYALREGDYGKLSSAQKKAIDKIVEHLNRQAALIGDILNLSKIEAMSFELMVNPLSVPEIVDEVIASLKHYIEERSHTLVVNIPKTLPSLMGDKFWVTTVVRNLLTNAVKYTPPNGEIIVRASEEAVNIHLMVIDNGIGIRKEDQDKIFTKFARIEQRTKGAPGLGIGLYITRQIVETLRGRIWVESSLGKGSTFHVLLPKILSTNRKK